MSKKPPADMSQKKIVPISIVAKISTVIEAAKQVQLAEAIDPDPAYQRAAARELEKEKQKLINAIQRYKEKT